MKAYKENRDKSKQVQEERIQKMKQLAKEEGTREEQLKKSGEKEEPVVIIDRIKTWDAILDDLHTKISEYTEYIFYQVKSVANSSLRVTALQYIFII